MKPSVPKAIFVSLLLTVIFFAVYTLASIVITFLFQLDFVQFISAILLKIRFFDEVVTSFSLYISTMVVAFAADILSKERKTRELAFRIVGWIILIAGVLGLILNIRYGNGFLINLCFILCGFIITRI